MQYYFMVATGYRYLKLRSSLSQPTFKALYSGDLNKPILPSKQWCGLVCRNPSNGVIIKIIPVEVNFVRPELWWVARRNNTPSDA